jgi:hypothetical protein
MSKNKNKPATKPTEPTPAAAALATEPTPAALATDTAPAKPKPKRKPADPNKIKLPWAQHQLRRVAKATKIVGKLAKSLKKHNAPGTDAQVAIDTLECLAAIGLALQSPEAVAYKAPVRVKKVTIGSTILVKGDVETRAAAVFTRLNPATGAPYLLPEAFTGATVIGDERTAWMVTCADGSVKLIGKKYVEISA